MRSSVDDPDGRASPPFGAAGEYSPTADLLLSVMAWPQPARYAHSREFASDSIGGTRVPGRDPALRRFGLVGRDRDGAVALVVHERLCGIATSAGGCDRRHWGASPTTASRSSRSAKWAVSSLRSASVRGTARARVKASTAEVVSSARMIGHAGCGRSTPATPSLQRATERAGRRGSQSDGRGRGAAGVSDDPQPAHVSSSAAAAAAVAVGCGALVS